MSKLTDKEKDIAIRVNRIIKAKVDVIGECIERVEECTFVEDAVESLRTLKRMWEDMREVLTAMKSEPEEEKEGIA